MVSTPQAEQTNNEKEREKVEFRYEAFFCTKKTNTPVLEFRGKVPVRVFSKMHIIPSTYDLNDGDAYTNLTICVEDEDDASDLCKKLKEELGRRGIEVV